MAVRDSAALAADAATEHVLYMLGLPVADACNICQHPLPDVQELAGLGSDLNDTVI